MNKIFSLLLASVLMVLVGCATTPTYIETELPKGEATLQQICDLYNIPWYWDSFSQVITLYYRNEEIVAMVGSDVVLKGEDRIELSSPLERKQSMIIVPSDFHAKVIGKRKKEKKAKFVQFDEKYDHSIKRFKNVLIDPGHGGKDPGAIGATGTTEKEVVFDVAKRLKYILDDYDIKATMTRNEDEFITLAKRTEIASRSKADLFISIHANASPSESAKGFEVYYLRNLDQKGKNEDQRRKNERDKFKKLKMTSDPQVKSIVSDMLYAHKQMLSPHLAEHISSKTAKDVSTRNRGEKQSGFYVLRNTIIPSILIEIGFLSNREEEENLKNPRYRQRIAESIAKNIINYNGY